MCNLWRHSRDGRKSDRVYGARGLSRLGLENGGGHSHCLRPRMPSAARQLYASAAVLAAHGGGTGADDSPGRCFAPDLALRGNGTRRMRPRRILRASAVRGRVWLAYLYRETRLLGTGGTV